MWPQHADAHYFDLAQSGNMVTDAMAGANRLYHRSEWQHMVRASDQDAFDHRRQVADRTERARQSHEHFEHLQSEVVRIGKLLTVGRNVIHDTAGKMSQMQLQIAKLRSENKRLSLTHA
jgi:uncharacterized protein YciI